MTVVTKPVGGPAVESVDESAALSAFLEPGCSAAIWHRQTPPGILTWLARQDPTVLPNGRVILRPAAVTETVRHLCDMAGLPDGSERDWLLQDIASLAQLFSDLMRAKFLRLRLQAVSNNACRKFHIDALTARLVCTYRGTGTQYGLSAHGGDPDHVLTVPTGAPILLRGTLWPTRPPSGVVHRSPPIEGTGETRLVLVLDPVFDPDDEA